MTALPKTIRDLFEQLSDNSTTELEAVQRLANAIRHADDRMLEEVRSVTLLHDARREAIFDELQHLACRLCALPVRGVVLEPRPVLDHPQQQPRTPEAVTLNLEPASFAGPCAGDWREATQRIDEEIDQYFGRAGPRH
jgi:hypothetical protein